MIIIDEFDELAGNQIYKAAELYLGTEVTLDSKLYRVSLLAKESMISITRGWGETRRLSTSFRRPSSNGGRKYHSWSQSTKGAFQKLGISGSSFTRNTGSWFSGPTSPSYRRKVIMCKNQ